MIIFILKLALSFEIHSFCPLPGLPIVGAVLAGAGFAWLIFYCRKRRKQHVQRLGSESTQTMSNKISTPPSSNKPLSSSPSAKFTRSIPSYPTSKSDLGRGSTYFGVQVFDYAELEEATDNFNPSRELGDGGFGRVYHGKKAYPKLFFALNLIDTDPLLCKKCKGNYCGVFFGIWIPSVMFILGSKWFLENGFLKSREILKS